MFFWDTVYIATSLSINIIIFDNRALRRSIIRVPECQKLQMTNPVWHMQDASWLFPYGNSGRQRVNVNKTSFDVSTTGTGK